MKKLILFLNLFAIAINLNAQITTTKVAPLKQTETISSNEPYDSLTNTVGFDLKKIIGQDLYLPCKSKILQQYGYSGFLNDYNNDSYIDTKNIYKCCSGGNSTYSKLNGKYFTVLDYYKHPKSNENSTLYGNTYFLKLKEKESGDIVYYRYYADVNSWDFIVVGYFQKLKTSDEFIGKKYVVRGNNWMSENEPMTDIETGSPVHNFNPGDIWTCVDITIEEKYCELSLILQNQNKEKITLGISYAKNASYNKWVVPFNMNQYYEKKFGKEAWLDILSGKVKIGMTKDACKISWGEPKDINRTVVSNKISEQWVYDSNYLYFDNNVLTAIQ